MTELGLFFWGITYALALIAGVVIAEVAMYRRIHKTLAKLEK